MASKKLISKIRGRAPMKELVDAYAEGILDGIQAERLRVRKSKEPVELGSALHRQIAPNGKTYEQLLLETPIATA